MKVYIEGKLYDADKTPIALLFANDNERKAAASHLSGMEAKPGIRAYAHFPDGTPIEQIHKFIDEGIAVYGSDEPTPYIDSAK